MRGARKAINQNHTAQNEYRNEPKTFELGDSVLDIPLKKTKQISQLIHLQNQQQEIINQIEQRSTKNHNGQFNQFNDSHSTSSKLPNQSTLSQEEILSRKPSFNSYLAGCIMRCFKFIKLSKEDISGIFNIKPDLIEQIEKFKILNDFRDANDTTVNPKLESMKKEVLDRLGQYVERCTIQKNPWKQLRSEFPQPNKKRRSNTTGNSQNSVVSSEQEHVMQQSSHSNIINYRSFVQTNNSHNPQIFQHTNDQQPVQRDPRAPLYQRSQGIFEYQRLLNNKPPYKLDKKMIALIQRIKKDPNLTQKQILIELDKQHGIRDMTQASVSRALKKIYYMKDKCNVISKAIMDGLVVI